MEMRKITHQNNYWFYLFIATWLLFFSCKPAKSKCTIRHIYTSSNTILGDSIFWDGKLSKVIFSDTIFGIDSIVYVWNSNGRLASVTNLKNGLPIFERVNYFDNGHIKKYEFIDLTSKFSYERDYNISGKIDTILGKPFFSCILRGMYSGNVPQDSLLRAYLYAPIPPNVETKIYTRFDDGSQEDFDRRRYLTNLFREDIRARGDGNKRWDIHMKFYDKDKDTIIDISAPLIFKILHTNI